MNRCLNDIFAYCQDKPQMVTATIDESYIGFGGRKYTCQVIVRTCKNHHPICPHYLTHAQLHGRILALHGVQS